MAKSTGTVFSVSTVLALILLLTPLSCGNSGEPVAPTTRGPRSLWLSHAAGSYVIEQARLCFCPGPHGFVQLTVVDNQIVEGVAADRGGSLTIEELERYKTVDELFDFIDEAQGRKPAVLLVKYDPDFGYPRNIYLDPHPEVADEEIRFDTRLLQLLP